MELNRQGLSLIEYLYDNGGQIQMSQICKYLSLSKRSLLYQVDKMNDFLRMCLNIITQIGPYLVVLLLLKYLVNLQQKRAKEREEEQKKGIIRTHYIIKTEKVLTMFFVLAVFLFGGATVASAIQQDDLFPPLVFSIFFIVSLTCPAVLP